MTETSKKVIETDAKKAPKMSLGWRIALVVSLGLNLAVVGVVGGAFFKHGRPDHVGARFDPIVRALEPAERRKIGREIRKHRAGKADRRAALEAAFAEVLVVLRAPEFDSDAMRSAMTQKSEALRQTRDTGETALIAHLSGLSADERAEFADRLEGILKQKRR